MMAKTWKKPILFLMVLAMALCACVAGLSGWTAFADEPTGEDTVAETKVTSVVCANAADTLYLYFSAGDSQTQYTNFESNIGAQGYEAFSDNLLVNGKSIGAMKADGDIGRIDLHVNMVPGRYSILLGLFKNSAAPWEPFDFVEGTTITVLPGFRLPTKDGGNWVLETGHETKARQDFYLTGSIATQAAWKEYGATELLLNTAETTLAPGQTLQLLVKAPSGLTDVTYESSTEGVATVSNDGLITAVADGTAEITVTSGTRSAKVAVTVTSQMQETGIRRIYGLNADSVIIIAFNHNETQTPKEGFAKYLGEPEFAAFTDNLLIDGKKLTELIEHTDGDDLATKLDVSCNMGRNTKPGDFSVEGRAHIYLGLKDGTKFAFGTTLTFKTGFRRPIPDAAAASGWALDGYEIKEDVTYYMCTKTMGAADPKSWASLAADALIMNTNSTQIKPEDEFALSVIVPKGLTDVAYTSSKPDVATVDNTGKVVGVADGVTTITVTSGERTATVEITVTANPFTGTPYTINTANVAYVGSEPWATIPSNHSATAPTAGINGEIAGIENQKAPFTDPKFSAFYDHILVNGVPYKDCKTVLGNTLGIRMFGGANKNEPMRIGQPLLTPGKTDMVITFLRGFQPLKCNADASVFEIDTDYMLLESISFRTTKSGAWKVLSKEEDVIYRQSPTALKVGDTGTVIAYAVRPYEEAAGANDIHYTSSDPSIVEINEATGAYTVKKGGTVKIVATYGTAKRELSYTVDSAVTLDQTSVSLRVGGTATLTPTIAATSGLTAEGAVWSSSAESVATVANGVVTAVAEGTATITVTLTNGDTATCAVSVSDTDTLSIAADKTNITYGQKITLTATTNSAADVVWTVSEGGGIFSAETGKTNEFTARKCGTFTITATLKDTDVTDTVEVTIISTIEITGKSEKIKAGETYTLQTKVAPTSMTYTYTTSNDKVATVDDKGVITGVAAGKATITATTDDGQTATFTITVFTPKTTTIQRVLMTDNATVQALFTASPYTGIAASPWTSLENIAKGEDIPEALEAFFAKIKINGQNFMEFWANQEREMDVNLHLGQVDQLLNLPCFEYRSNGSSPKAYPVGTTIVFEAGMPLPERINGTWRLSEYTLDRTYVYETPVFTAQQNLTEATAGAASFVDDTVTLKKGEQKTLAVAFSGNKYAAAYAQVMFASGDTSVLTVDENGKITAVAAGEVIVTLTLGEQTDTVAVVVTDEGDKPGPDKPDPDKPDPDKPTEEGGKKKGCGSAASASMGAAALLVLALGSVLALRRRSVTNK